MKHKHTIQAGLLVLFGFIVGFAAHAYLAGEIAEEVAEQEMQEEVVVNEETAKGVVEEENTVVTEEVTVSHDAGLNRLAYGDISVHVKDQASGGSVFLTDMTLDDTLWVAVRESIDGELGSILGAHKYTPEATSGVVELLRNTESGNVYHIVLYTEDGDGAFDHTKDELITNTEGQVVTAQFLTL